MNSLAGSSSVNSGEVSSTFVDYVGSVTLEINKSVVPIEFLTNRDGLYLDDKFPEVFGDGDVLVTPQVTLSKYVVKNKSGYDDTFKVLTGSRGFEASLFCHALISLLTERLDNKPGQLANSPFMTFFRVWNKMKTELFVVSVRWYDDIHGREWRVFVWEPNGMSFSVGDLLLELSHD